MILRVQSTRNDAFLREQMIPFKQKSEHVSHFHLNHLQEFICFVVKAENAYQVRFYFYQSQLHLPLF